MTRSSNTSVVPHVEDPESIIHKKKDKSIEGSSGFEKVQDEKVEDYEIKAPESEKESETELEEEMSNIANISMGEYKRRMCDDTVHPTIPATTNFELKGHILVQLKDIPFYRHVQSY